MELTRLPVGSSVFGISLNAQSLDLRRLENPYSRARSVVVVAEDGHGTRATPSKTKATAAACFTAGVLIPLCSFCVFRN
jgi:hypothetical protein